MCSDMVSAKTALRMLHIAASQGFCCMLVDLDQVAAHFAGGPC